MTRSRPAVPALALLLLLSGCAQPPAGPADPAPTPSGPAASAGLVLGVEQTGGLVPSTTVGRLPLLAVYADGQVITEGPVPAIYPGPALPNLQVHTVDRTGVQDLVDRALEAGVAETTDLGSPPVADAFTTRFTLVLDDRTVVREVYALHETPDRGEVEGVTPDQAEDRKRLRDLLDSLTAPGDAAGTAPYEPAAVAAIASPWIDPQDGLAHPEQPWPGPRLPGEPVPGPTGVGCVTATGEEAAALLAAASSATTLTPWTTADGSRWSVTFRPLLPDESGCADLIG
jgi:hypothetical protein